MKASEQIWSPGLRSGGDRTAEVKAKPSAGDGDEGVGSHDRGLEPSSPDPRLLLTDAVGLLRASLGGGGAPAAQPPAAAGEVRVPPRQERGVRGLQVPGPHSGVRRAGQLLTPFPPLELEQSILLLLLRLLSDDASNYFGSGVCFRRRASSGSTWRGGWSRRRTTTSESTSRRSSTSAPRHVFAA